MRILSFTPIAVGEQELARRQARYDEHSPDGVEVVLRDIGTGSGAPTALETPEDVATSERAVLAAFAAADPEGFDAFLPDCVLDPGIDDQDGLARPLLGIGRLTASFLASQGTPLFSVARNPAIAAELDRRFASYGLTAPDTRVLDLSFDAIADDRVWNETVERSVADLDGGFVFNACSAVDVAPSAGGAVLVDPTATALRLIGLRASLDGSAA
ncbi:hydantoin racemase [Aeromicrobium sp. CFBP 8757]|uniref:hydantoin racemase n=1 Tax=Aeromicrobium sp. CFBP 8757 TaxID=2775288 RepID=UPI00177E028A|nr:hydantoin racemase [Aeromicrobium sp. CFBP 8757]MBD8605785.1 hydantoin racemase [Aeromicrobium sp. CFBP 8757]